MIQNERQYKVATIKRQELFSALADLKAQPASAVGLRQQLHQQGIASQLESLDQELDQYRALTTGNVVFEHLDIIERLPTLLIELRLAARLNHRTLGELLGVHEEQIRRYEATGYSGASLDRVLSIVEVCRTRVQEQQPSTSWVNDPEARGARPA
ncbi:helix-turn-helix transcriptional regulator [Deinococcus sp.]|uniref:helix-turn-helix domain-containing protein n=1 Tax=Deinococcus sp. TaxID=47478 RepID=UPI0025DF23CE|nr:helix-turn-helix transcriptional regulator [Deinococcus sp.]